MELPNRQRLLLLLLISVQSLSVTSSFFPFSPTDNYLINCGSRLGVTIDNRLFTPDSSSLLSSPARTVEVTNADRVPTTIPIYKTARVFTKPSKYVFDVKDNGTYVVRLHFFSFNSSDFQLSNAEFHVLGNEYVLMSNFSGGNSIEPLIKEFLIWVDAGKVAIMFVPSKDSNFGFVNAVEVFSAPKDLILETAKFVGGNKFAEFDGLNRQALEVVYRLNVGGPKVTPFNDTLWRTWVPDDRFFKSEYGWKKVFFSGRIKYQEGGPSREVCPDNVYNSARVISSKNETIPSVNMTWLFPVDGGYKYLVRLHFCDIASISIGLLYFNVYVNEHLAFKDLDLSFLVGEVLASPHYVDFLVDGDVSGNVGVSIGPSKYSMSHAIDGILNGVEVMKMNNSRGSLDGHFCAGFIKQNMVKRHVGFFVPMIAVILMVLSVFMVIHRRNAGVCHSAAWTTLPTDVTEADTKAGNPHS